MKKRSLTAMAATAIIVAGSAALLSGCQSQADTVSTNISTDAEQFKVERQIVFYNGITDRYIFEVTGRCSVDAQEALDNTLAVTCKIGPNKYIKDMLHNADNVTWFALQTKPIDESVYHYKVVLKPENITPDLEINMGQQ